MIRLHHLIALCAKLVAFESTESRIGRNCIGLHDVVLMVNVVREYIDKGAFGCVKSRALEYLSMF